MKVVDIAFKRIPGGEMETLEKVNVTIENGIENDCRGQNKNAQITILSKESWNNACKELNRELDWTVRRVNLLVEGFDIINSKGIKLKIGNQVVLQITGECKPCNLMEKQVEGLYNALIPDWRGGAEAIVLSEGVINKDDDIFLF